MVSVFTVVILSLLFSILQNGIESKRCYAESNFSGETYSWFTSYPFSRRSAIRPLEGCEFIHVWGLVRHGTRYPCRKDTEMMEKSTKIRDEIISNHEKKQGELCEKDLQNLKKWKTKANKHLKMKLTSQGIEDVAFFAKNVKESFPMMTNTFQRDQFEFMSSNINRTRQTALIFSNVLLETNFRTIDGNNIKIDDIFLNFENHCPVYDKQIERSHQAQEFKNSKYYKEMVIKVSKRLGYKKPLSPRAINNMYLICAYEKAWYPNSKPPFCAAFSLEDLKVLEYDIDMQLYYKRGHGNPIANRMACPIIQDMMMSLSNASMNEGKKGSRGRFLFTHSETLVPTTVKLGFSRDTEPLSVENYPELVEKRKWKTAYFDCFTGNIIAALYSCPSEVGLQNVVMFYQNEYPAVVPECSSNPCTLEELQNIFRHGECDMRFCNAKTYW